MRIIESYNNDAINDVIEVVSADYVHDHLIRILFNDHSVITIDFEPFLSKSQHPSIKKYLDKDLFKNFDIKDGNLNWNDYDLIFPVYDLYSGKIA